MLVNLVSFISCRFPQPPLACHELGNPRQQLSHSGKQVHPSSVTRGRACPGIPAATPHAAACRGGGCSRLGRALGHSWNVIFNRTSGERQARECAGVRQPSAVQACLRGGGQSFPGGQNAKTRGPSPTVLPLPQ